MTIQTQRAVPAAAGEQARAPLSFAQEQLWFLDQLTPGEATYNSLMVWRLHGSLRPDVLERCLSLIVARHESLRITIRDEAGVPYQVVAAPAEVPLLVTDLRGLPEDERGQRVQAEIDSQRAEPYDLRVGPLYRFRLLWLDAEEYVFLLGLHHIVTDGWSAVVLNRELSAAYRSRCAGIEPVFADQELDYTEFAEAQRNRLQGEVLAEELAFWRQRLAGLPTLELPTDRPRAAGGSRPGQTLISDFPMDLRGLAQQLAGDHGASLFMVFAAAFSVVLSRYAGQEDIPIGITMLGRPQKKLESVVGMFVNMAVLRSDLSGDPTFSELIERITDGVFEIYDHQEVSFTEVVDAVQPVRDPDRNPLFQVCLQLLNKSTSGEDLDFPGVDAEYVALASSGSRFDLSLNVIDSGSSLRGSVEYSTDLFDSWRPAVLLVHVESVLRSAAADPSRRLSQIPIVVGEEAEQLLAAGRRAAAEPGRLPESLGRQHADRQTCGVYVVDRWLNLLPRGVDGEVLLSYEPDGAATDSAEPAGDFIDDPFSPGRRAYRSGIRARWDFELQLKPLDRQDGSTGEDAEPGAGLHDAGTGGDQPSTPTEQVVADIFSEVLSLPGIGAGEGFFDQGGNSLQAMRAIGRINDEFGIRLSVRTLYGNVTVRAVAAAVDQKVGSRSA